MDFAWYGYIVVSIIVLVVVHFWRAAEKKYEDEARMHRHTQQLLEETRILLDKATKRRGRPKGSKNKTKETFTYNK